MGSREHTLQPTTHNMFAAARARAHSLPSLQRTCHGTSTRRCGADSSGGSLSRCQRLVRPCRSARITHHNAFLTSYDPARSREVWNFTQLQRQRFSGGRLHAPRCVCCSDVRSSRHLFLYIRHMVVAMVHAIHTYINTYIHTYTYACVCVCVCVCTYTYIHTYIHTYI
jgi:hypothetical protein